MKEVEKLFSDFLDGLWEIMSDDEKELADVIAHKIVELENK